MGEVNIISSTVAVISPCNLGPGDLSCLRRHKLRAEGRALLLPPVSDSEPGELRVLTHGFMEGEGLHIGRGGSVGGTTRQ